MNKIKAHKFAKINFYYAIFSTVLVFVFPFFGFLDHSQKVDFGFYLLFINGICLAVQFYFTFMIEALTTDNARLCFFLYLLLNGFLLWFLPKFAIS